MAFWQENYAFIKEVFDKRSEKMVELMDKADKAITEVHADKIYTSNEFKKVKENFTGISKNMENSEVKDWLMETKETLMGERDSKAQAEEGDKLNKVLGRYDALIPKIADTKLVVDSLWKSYQFTDELAPHQEWLQEKKQLAVRDINTNGAGETEEHIEKQEKVLDQLDKKRKVILELIAKGTKLKDDPKAPVFLSREVSNMKTLWEETLKMAEGRLQNLRDNLAAWERYEQKRDDLIRKLDEADAELIDIKKVYDMAEAPKDHQNRLKTAASIRKNLDEVFGIMNGANEILQILLTDDMKAELNDAVASLKSRMDICNAMDEKLKNIDAFNGKLKIYEGVVKELENWLAGGRKKMDELLKPAKPMEPEESGARSISLEERVLLTMDLCEDIKKQLEIHGAQQKLWDEELQPTEPGENTPEAQEIASRMDKVCSSLSELSSEAEAEAAKFGEDVKYLADFTNGVRKFEPWMTKSEEKAKKGLGKPTSLEEATAFLADCQQWKGETESMKAMLDEAYEAAKKMTLHEDADRQYTGFVKKWDEIDKLSKEWIVKMEGLVQMWQKQAETAEKVTAAIAAPQGAGADMKLEDLEAHLNALKQMFIEKQKMMESIDQADAASAAPAATAP